VAPEPPPVEETVTVVKPSPKVAAAPGTVPPATRPGTTPAAPAGTMAPAATTPAAPPPAAQAATFVQQAQAAASAGNYDGAVTLYDQALKVDPGNAAATSGRATADTARASLRRRFVPGRTIVQTPSKGGGGLAGFDSSDVKVKQAPDFQGRIEFAMSPPSVKAGDAYRLQIALVNEGKKDIKIAGVNVLTTINGKALPRPVTPKARAVDPQQRVVLDELSGTWPEDVKTWQTEVLVNAGKGESLKSQLSWR
jgi:hypothetical protein